MGSVSTVSVSEESDIQLMAPMLAGRLTMFHLETQPVSMFGGSNMIPLQIDMCGNTIRGIKIKHVGSGSLNLSAIRVFDQKGCRIDMSSASIEFSSIHGCDVNDVKDIENKTREAESDLLGFSDKSTYFRTLVQDAPWIMVNLGGLHRVKTVELHTKKNHLAKRDWMLDLDYSEDLVNWTSGHSQSGSLKKRMADESQTARSVLTEQQYKIYLQSLEVSGMYVRNGQLGMRKITEKLNAHDLSIDEQACVKFCVNAILRPFQAEIAAHGVTRSYRFWSLREKRAELEHANEVVGLLQNLVGEACLGFGTCLGAVREGNFIPHDDDIDIIVFHKNWTGKTFKEATENMLEILIGGGVDAKYSTEFHVKVSLCPGKIVDVFCGLERDGNLDWHPGKKAVHTYDDIYPAVSIPFMGVESLIPRNAVLYLERVYGKDWRTPMPFFAHYSKNNSNFTSTAKAA